MKTWGVIDLDELEFLLDSGETPETACRRLGYNPASVARAYYRAGKPADARPFGALGARYYYRQKRAVS